MKKMIVVLSLLMLVLSGCDTEPNLEEYFEFDDNFPTTYYEEDPYPDFREGIIVLQTIDYDVFVDDGYLDMSVPGTYEIVITIIESGNPENMIYFEVTITVLPEPI